MLECEIRAPVPFHTLIKTNTDFFILHYCHIKGRNLLRCNLQHLEIYKVLSKETVALRAIKMVGLLCQMLTEK